MKMVKTYTQDKKIIKICAILLITFCMIFVVENNIYATGNAVKYQAIQRRAKEEGLSMSAEALREAIENLYGSSNIEDIYRINGYKDAYKEKTGETYNQTTSGNGNIGSQGSLTDPILNPGEYDPTQETVEAGKIAEIISKIFGIFRAFAIVVSVVSLIIIGYRFIIGSVEDRAKYKETLIPYIVGFTLTVSILGILELLFKLFFNI